MPPRMDPINRDITEIKNKLDTTLQAHDAIEHRLDNLENKVDTIDDSTYENRLKLLESKVEMLSDMCSLIRNNLEHLSYIVKAYPRSHSPHRNFNPHRSSKPFHSTKPKVSNDDGGHEPEYAEYIDSSEERIDKYYDIMASAHNDKHTVKQDCKQEKEGMKQRNRCVL